MAKKIVDVPNTAQELRELLSEQFVLLSEGQLSVKAATELSNMAGKITNTVKMQLEYAKLRKEKPEISFLNCN